jgi:hypothetical protein
MNFKWDLEAPSGLEPLHRGFADLSLKPLGYGAKIFQNNRTVIVLDKCGSNKGLE